VSQLHSLTIPSNVNCFERKSTIRRVKHLYLEDPSIDDYELTAPVRAHHRIAWDIAYQCTATLETLVLAGCSFLQHKTLRRLLFRQPTFPNLILLDVSDTNITDKTVCNMTQSMPKLRALYMSNCKDLTSAVLDALAPIPQLELLSITRNITQDHLDQFCLTRFKHHLKYGPALSIQTWSNVG